MQLRISRSLYEEDMGTKLLALDAQIVRESVRERDKNGYLHVRTSRLTQEQVAPYYGREIPGWEERGLDPERIYYGYRSPEELKAALPTFNGVPLLFEHRFDSAEHPNTDLRVGTVGTSAQWEPPYVTNALSVWDERAIAAIEDGTLRDLSCGYRYTPDFTPGETADGLAFDFVMRDIACNHVALVNDGRAPDCYVEDSKPRGLSAMENEVKTEGAADSFADAVRRVIEDAQTGLAPDVIDALVTRLAQLHEPAPAAPAADEEPAAEPAPQPAAQPEPEPAQAPAEDEAETPAPAEKEEPAPGAMDAAAITSAVRRQLSAQYQAADEVRGVLGNVSALAYDSADAIYLDALRSMGVKDTPKSAAKYVFAALQSVRGAAAEPVGAQDAAPETGDAFLAKFIR